MRIIHESKEKLPVDFMTQFVSKGWEEIGNLKASRDAIKKEFKDTKNVEKIIQDLEDAYLVAVGQMELFLNDKNYVDIPEKSELKEDLLEFYPDTAIQSSYNKPVNIDRNKILELIKNNRNVTIEQPELDENGVPILTAEILQEWD